MLGGTHLCSGHTLHTLFALDASPAGCLASAAVQPSKSGPLRCQTARRAVAPRRPLRALSLTSCRSS
eukprot:366510-Chlamydomonas_euryale.AAC.18